MLKLYNTLTRKKESFKPFNTKQVHLYTCGPTVYWFAHIGNLRTYIFEDILKRTLQYNNYKVKHVMNITDVGHLTSDADSGEDKMIKALKREGKELNQESILEIADYYTKAFQKDLKSLNIQEPDIWCKATEYIEEQKELIKKIITNGYAYETDKAVYFDTLKLKEYPELAQLDLGQQEEGVRVKKQEDKKNPTDFALWIKLKGEHKNHIMNWDSPWGKGFPGWHVECSAMSIKNLDSEIDIHCGGIDHIPVHHTNERAQNIAAIEKPIVRFWMHGEFLILKDGKMSKSKGNIKTLKNLEEKGYDPLAYRYLCLGAHYRSQLIFSEESLRAAENGLKNLREKIKRFKEGEKTNKTPQFEKYIQEFQKIINDDLDMPKALALTSKMINDDSISNFEKYNLLLEFDKVFGLGFKNIKAIKVPEKIKELVKKRSQYRKERKFKKADQIRKKIKELGYQIEDRDEKTIIKEK
jgi:cysteinyl-tRNA synthetase